MYHFSLLFSCAKNYGKICLQGQKKKKEKKEKRKTYEINKLKKNENMILKYYKCLDGRNLTQSVKISKLRVKKQTNSIKIKNWQTKNKISTNFASK